MTTVRVSLLVLCLISLSYGLSFSPISPLPVPKYSVSCTTLDDLVFCMGGSSTLWSGVPQNDAEYYDMRTNTWTTIAPMPTPKLAALAVAINGTVWSIGGIYSQDPAPPLNSIDKFDPFTNSWSQSSISLPYPVVDGGAAVLNNNLYIFGSMVQILSLSTNLWSTQLFPRSRSCAVYATYGDRYVLVAGGQDYNGETVNYFDMYDSVTSIWTILPNMPVATKCTVGYIIGSSFYVVAGSAGGSVLPPNVQTYDLNLGTWSSSVQNDMVLFGSGYTMISNVGYAVGGISHVCSSTNCDFNVIPNSSVVYVPGYSASSTPSATPSPSASSYLATKTPNASISSSSAISNTVTPSLSLSPTKSVTASVNSTQTSSSTENSLYLTYSSLFQVPIYAVLYILSGLVLVFLAVFIGYVNLQVTRSASVYCGCFAAKDAVGLLVGLLILLLRGSILLGDFSLTNLIFALVEFTFTVVLSVFPIAVVSSKYYKQKSEKNLFLACSIIQAVFSCLLAGIYLTDFFSSDHGDNSSEEKDKLLDSLGLAFCVIYLLVVNYCAKIVYFSCCKQCILQANITRKEQQAQSVPLTDLAQPGYNGATNNTVQEL